MRRHAGLLALLACALAIVAAVVADVLLARQ